MSRTLSAGGRGNTKPGLIEDEFSSKRSRNWCFTCYDLSASLFDDTHMSYMITGKEVCPTTGREHLQGYVHFINDKSWKAVKKILKNINFRKCNGDPESNIAYCAKDTDFIEYGIRPKKGRRTDLEGLAKEVMSGKSVDLITIEDPMSYHVFGRTLNRLETLYRRSQWRTFRTIGTWYFGTTGTGKSHRAFENYHPTTHYNLVKDHGWWDGYTQQETVIINDFRGWLDYNMLLNIVDDKPMSVNRRGNEPIPFMSKHVIITSSLSPDKVYHNRMEGDSIEQLYRRFRVIECVNKLTEMVINEPY